jgi:hypothetical protein
MQLGAGAVGDGGMREVGCGGLGLGVGLRLFLAPLLTLPPLLSLLPHAHLGYPCSHLGIELGPDPRHSAAHHPQNKVAGPEAGLRAAPHHEKLEEKSAHVW